MSSLVLSLVIALSAPGRTKSDTPVSGLPEDAAPATGEMVTSAEPGEGVQSEDEREGAGLEEPSRPGEEAPVGTPPVAIPPAPKTTVRGENDLEVDLGRQRFHQLPPRPERDGLGMFVGVGVLTGLAIGSQIFAYHITRAYERCLDDIITNDTEGNPTPTEEDIPFLGCYFGPAFEQWVRNTGTLEMAGAAALAGAGAALRGKRDAYDWVFYGDKRRKTRKLMIAGGTLLGIGTVGWLTARIVLVAAPVCDDHRCVVLYDSIATDVAALAAGVGAGLLGYALAYHRARRHYHQYRLRMSPTVGKVSGLSLTGRF